MKSFVPISKWGLHKWGISAVVGRMWRRLGRGIRRVCIWKRCVMVVGVMMVVWILQGMEWGRRGVEREGVGLMGEIERARRLWGGGRAGNGQWEKVMGDVVIGVKTGHEVAAKRLGKLKRSGWWSVGRRVPNLLVMSDEGDEGLGVVGVREYAAGVLANETGDDSGVDWPEGWFERSGWKGDKDKNLPMLHMMRWVFPGKGWYVLMDDDTYLFLENFARFITKEAGREGEALYTGKVFYISKCGGFARDGSWAANRSEEKGMFAHGGSGIVVNGVAMEKVYPRIGECIREYSSCWAGDMQVGLCLRKTRVLVRKRGGKSGYERHFIPFGPSKALSDRRYTSRWKSSEEPVTFHKIAEEEEELVSRFEKGAKGGVVKYNELREYLMGHGVVPCHTEHNKKIKWYTEEFMPPELKSK